MNIIIVFFSNILIHKKNSAKFSWFPKSEILAIVCFVNDLTA